MKNVMVANMQPKGRYSKDKIEVNLRAQIHNSLDVGWNPADIFLLSNFAFEYMGVTALQVKLPDYCLTGSKMFGVLHLLKKHDFNGDVLWVHDLDAWQNVWFDAPEIKDVGISTYSQANKYNGGSLFWKKSGISLAEMICEALKDEQREEPTINRIFKAYKENISILNNTYNVGCSGYVPRMEKAVKPIKVAHFNPCNKVAWQIHRHDRDGAGFVSVSDRLEGILKQYYELKFKQPLN